MLQYLQHEERCQVIQVSFSWSFAAWLYFYKKTIIEPPIKMHSSIIQRGHCIKISVFWHIKTRNRKGYENHVITLYSVVTWFFFYKFFLIFREFKADLTVTWLKCVAFLGYPSLAGKMGKREK